MEILTAICEKLWIIMILGAFFICLAKGWLKKGFYITGDQIPETDQVEEKTESGTKQEGFLEHVRKEEV